MAHLYRSDLFPPIPVLPVVLYHAASGVGSAEISALVDTGADATLVAARYLRQIAAEELYVTRVRSHWGESRAAKIYLVDMEVVGQRLPGVEVIADDQSNDVLLGRTVLNRLILLLDGPGRRVDLLAHRPRRLPTVT